jgi:hypothetical protein
MPLFSSHTDDLSKAIDSAGGGNIEITDEMLAVLCTKRDTESLNALGGVPNILSALRVTEDAGLPTSEVEGRRAAHRYAAAAFVCVYTQPSRVRRGGSGTSCPGHACGSTQNH